MARERPPYYEVVRRVSYWEAPADYIIFKDGGQTKAKDGKTGVIRFQGYDASEVIQDAISAIEDRGGGKLYICPGEYEIKNTIQLCLDLKIEGACLHETKLVSDWYLDGPMLQYSGDSGTRIDIRDIYLYNPPGYNSTIGIDFKDLVGDKYIENIFTQGFTDYGIYDANGWNARFFGCTFEGGMSTNPNDSTIVYIGGHDFKIIGCKFLYGGIGLYAYGVGQIVGNFFFRNSKHGLHVASGSNIVANTFKSNSYGNTDVYSDIDMGSSGNRTNYSIVTANRFIGEDEKYAINLTGGTYLVQVFGNVFEGTFHSGIVNTLSHAKFGYNYGFATINSGTSTFSGDGSTTQFTIPHGLVAEPSKVQVTPMSADAAGDFYVTKDATNIYVNYKTAPTSGSDNVVLSWYAEV